MVYAGVSRAPTCLRPVLFSVKKGCSGLGVQDGVGLQALPVLLVGAGLRLLQVGKSCGILIARGYIEGQRVLASAGFDDR